MRASNNHIVQNRNTSGLKRGGPGRKPGVPNRTTVEIRDLARKLFDEEYWKRAHQRVLSGRIAPAVEAKLLAYAYGEPKQQIDLSGQVNVVGQLEKKVVFELHPGPTRGA